MKVRTIYLIYLYTSTDNGKKTSVYKFDDKHIFTNYLYRLQIIIPTITENSNLQT